MRPGYRYTFTVFTPSFNRAHTLPRVYASLIAQTFRDFEWLIVDDGSTDHTQELVQQWRAESALSIRYLRQENRGKHIAFNRAVQEARGELFLTLDSDDACVAWAFERLKHHWEAIPEEARSTFSAVTVLCQDPNGKRVGDPFPQYVLDSDSIELMFKYRVRGEKWGFQRTDVLKMFPFPSLPDARFIPESVVWLAISRKFRTRFVNEPLRIYHLGDSGDHISELNVGTVRSRAFFHRQLLNDFIDLLPCYPWSLFRSAVNLNRYSFDARVSPWHEIRQLSSVRARVLLLASLPLGYLISFRDKAKLTRDDRSVREAVAELPTRV